MINRATVFLIFAAVQFAGFLLLAAVGAVTLRSANLVLETAHSVLVLHPPACMALLAGVLGLDLLQSTLIVRLFNRFG